MDTQDLAIKFYTRIQLHHKILCNWILYLVPIVIFAVSIGMLLGLYGIIRFTSLPFLLYAPFPLTTLLLTALFVGFTYDIVSLQLTSEKVLGKIRPHSREYFVGLPRYSRSELKLRALTLKPVTFPVGRFKNVSVNVIRRSWEEILNHLILLLSF